MKNFLLMSALALALSAPAFAAQDHHGGGHGSSPGGSHTGGHTPLSTGGHRNRGSGHLGNPFGNQPFSVGGHNRGRHDGFDAFRHIGRSPHQYHYGSYRRPHGWYYRNWVLGDILPTLFFSRDYWLNDYYDFGLVSPPPGTMWVRYGDDALLIDRNTGEVIRVVRGVFY
jgi:Ni/Co efflux regulator RcnB